MYYPVLIIEGGLITFIGSGFCKKNRGGGCLIKGGGHDIGCIPCSKAQKIKKLRSNNWESIIKLAHLKKCFSFYF